MGLKYLTEKAYETLLDNIQIDQDKYSTPTVWLPEYFKDKEFCRESRITASGSGLALYMEGDKNSSDIVNVRMVFDNLYMLTPQQASNQYLWSYLSLVDCWDYSLWRWGKSLDDDGITEITEDVWNTESVRATNIKQRFLCQPSRIGLLRNSISRLWWYGYLSYQPGATAHKYELTKLLLSQSDLCQSIMERNFSMNRNICGGILQAIKEINDDPNLENVGRSSKTNEYEWRDLCKYLNRMGAVTLLDIMTQDDIKDISYNYILKQRK